MTRHGVSTNSGRPRRSIGRAWRARSPAHSPARRRVPRKEPGSRVHVLGLPGETYLNAGPPLAGGIPHWKSAERASPPPPPERGRR